MDLHPSSIRITMAHFSGSRERAASLAQQHQGNLRGNTVIVDCRQLVHGSQKFADQFVKSFIVDGNAAEVVLVYPSGEFLAWFTDAANQHGVAGRVRMDNNIVL